MPDLNLSAHQAACKAANQRKILYRAGELVQAHWYDFRRAAFDVKIKDVLPPTAGKLHVYEEAKLGNTNLFKFPDDKFTTENDTNAILVWSACIDGPV